MEIKAKAKRPFFGGPFVRVLDIGLEDPRPENAPAPVPPPESVDQKLTVKPRKKKNLAAPSPGSEEPPLANASFVQKAVMARGLLSLLGLLFALSVFAIVITLALSRIVGQSAADRNLALEIAQARNAAATSGSSGMSGTVLLLTSGQPVPGVAIDVLPGRRHLGPGRDHGDQQAGDLVGLGPAGRRLQDHVPRRRASSSSGSRRRSPPTTPRP